MIFQKATEKVKTTVKLGGQQPKALDDTAGWNVCF